MIIFAKLGVQALILVGLRAGFNLGELIQHPATRGRFFSKATIGNELQRTMRSLYNHYKL